MEFNVEKCLVSDLVNRAATTPIRPEVSELMRLYFSERFGNLSSPHSYGLEARAAIERAR